MNKITRAVFAYIKDMDKMLLLFCLSCSGYGIIVLLGVVNTFHDFTARPVTMRTVIVQAMATGIGVVAALIMAKIDYRFMAKMWKIHVPLCYLLVILTFLYGVGREGADDKAWIPLPLGLQLQPSEFLKLSFILTFALHLEKAKSSINTLRTLIPLCIHGAIPVLAIHLQGDDGSALVIFLIFLTMIFAAGLSYKYLLIALIAIAAAAPLLWFFVMNYDQKMRILCLFDHSLDPQGIFYQQNQGLRASLGSGTFFRSAPVCSGNTQRLHFCFYRKCFGLCRMPCRYRIDCSGMHPYSGGRPHCQRSTWYAHLLRRVCYDRLSVYSQYRDVPNRAPCHRCDTPFFHRRRLFSCHAVYRIRPCFQCLYA